MAPESSNAYVAQGELLALLQQYELASNDAERGLLLDRITQLLATGQSEKFRDRVAEWLLGLPADEASGGATDYARYTALLPRVLAGTLPPDSEEYAEFVAFVAESDIGLHEYLDLEENIESGYKAWSEGNMPPQFGVADLSFLRQ